MTAHFFHAGGSAVGIPSALPAFVQEAPMTCPSCRSEKEMLFLVLCLSFVCQEAHCGLEIQMDSHDAEVILQPKENLTFA